MKKSEVVQVHIDPAHTISINLQILKQLYKPKPVPLGFN